MSRVEVCGVIATNQFFRILYLWLDSYGTLNNLSLCLFITKLCIVVPWREKWRPHTDTDNQQRSALRAWEEGCRTAPVEAWSRRRLGGWCSAPVLVLLLKRPCTCRLPRFMESSVIFRVLCNRQYFLLQLNTVGLEGRPVIGPQFHHCLPMCVPWADSEIVLLETLEMVHFELRRTGLSLNFMSSSPV